MAKGIAIKISPTLMSQKCTNQPLSAVGKKALLVGSVVRLTFSILPKCTKPVKNTTVSGVP